MQEINVVVTAATRTEKDISNVDRSVTVIDKKEIPNLQSTQGSLAETNNLNLFGKVGYDLGKHRLELTANHYDSDQDTEFLTDPSVNEFVTISILPLPRSYSDFAPMKAIRLHLELLSASNTPSNFKWEYKNANVYRLPNRKLLLH